MKNSTKRVTVVGIEPLKTRHNVTKLNLTILLLSFSWLLSRDQACLWPPSLPRHCLSCHRPWAGLRDFVPSPGDLLSPSCSYVLCEHSFHCCQSHLSSDYVWPIFLSFFSLYLAYTWHVETWGACSFVLSRGLNSHLRGSWSHFDFFVCCSSPSFILYFDCWLLQANMVACDILCLFLLLVYSLHPDSLVICSTYSQHSFKSIVLHWLNHPRYDHSSSWSILQRRHSSLCPPHVMDSWGCWFWDRSCTKGPGYPCPSGWELLSQTLQSCVWSDGSSNSWTIGCKITCRDSWRRGWAPN